MERIESAGALLATVSLVIEKRSDGFYAIVYKFNPEIPSTYLPSGVPPLGPYDTSAEAENAAKRADEFRAFW